MAASGSVVSDKLPKMTSDVLAAASVLKEWCTRTVEGAAVVVNKYAEEAHTYAASVVGEEKAFLAVVVAAAVAATAATGIAVTCVSTLVRGKWGKARGKKGPRLLGVIPAGFSSSPSFPGKPLAMVLGKPMVQHAYEEAARCEALDMLVIATDDQRIYERCKALGENAVVKLPSSCSNDFEFCHKAATCLREECGDFDVVVRIPSDELLMKASSIDETVRAHTASDRARGVAMTLAVAPTPASADTNGKAEAFSHIANMTARIKVAMNVHGEALFFSRNPIPSGGKGGGYHMSLGIACIEAHALERLAEPMLSTDNLALREGIDDVWPLELGMKVQCAPCDRVYRYHTVKAPHDVAVVESIMRTAK